MKQNVNHSHRLKTWAEMLPQFWHCTVTFSYPFNGDLKTCVPHVNRKNMLVSFDTPEVLDSSNGFLVYVDAGKKYSCR